MIPAMEDANMTFSSAFLDEGIYSMEISDASAASTCPGDVFLKMVSILVN